MLQSDFLLRAITQILQPWPDKLEAESENIKGGGDWRSGVTILLPLYHCLPRVEEFQIHKFSVRSYNFRLGGESN